MFDDFVDKWSPRKIEKRLFLKHFENEKSIPLISAKIKMCWSMKEIVKVNKWLETQIQSQNK